jgi:hypothetical protein
VYAQCTRFQFEFGTCYIGQFIGREVELNMDYVSYFNLTWSARRFNWTWSMALIQVLSLG